MSDPQMPRIDAFRVADALASGVPYALLRRNDLARPFRGVRSRGSDVSVVASDPFAQQRAEHLERVLEYSPLLLEHTFISHESAVAWYDGPLPLQATDGHPRDGRKLDVHVSVFGKQALPDRDGVRGHRAKPETSEMHEVDGLRIATPASLWASMGHLNVRQLVVLGDHLCRVWREGVGRTAATAPLATREDLAAFIAKGRRRGIPKLREALELIREDSWSPKETETRLVLLEGGLPEPSLNVDVFDAFGRFLGCLDMAYLREKVGVEYNGLLHAAQYAKDVERIARLRAAGWIIIEVTAELLANPYELVRRVYAALMQQRVAA